MPLIGKTSGIFLMLIFLCNDIMFENFGEILLWNKTNTEKSETKRFAKEWF